MGRSMPSVRERCLVAMSAKRKPMSIYGLAMEIGLDPKSDKRALRTVQEAMRTALKRGEVTRTSMPRQKVVFGQR